jgi:hypothetical protein
MWTRDLICQRLWVAEERVMSGGESALIPCSKAMQDRDHWLRRHSVTEKSYKMPKEISGRYVELRMAERTSIPS